MARTALCLALALCLLGAATANPSDPRSDAYKAANPTGGLTALTDPATTTSGMSAIPTVEGVLQPNGRFLVDASAAGSTLGSLLEDYAATEGWSDTFTQTNLTGLLSVDGAAATSVGMASTVTDTLMQPFLWLADTAGSTIYKVDTTKTGATAVVGAYATRPSAAAGNPVAIAVQSNGDAFVGNAFTFAADEIGSLTKIQAASDWCGALGTATELGTTSLDAITKGWPSTTLGSVYKLVDGVLTLVPDSPLPTLADNLDSCVKAWVDMNATDPNAAQVSIAAVAADGADNVWTMALNEAVKGDGYFRLYKANKNGGANTVVFNQYKDLNFVAGLSGTGDGPGAPGGSGMVVDKWGFLWSGGGTYKKAGKYIVIRIDTNVGNPSAKGVQIYSVPHEANALALDNDGNLWVAGQGGATNLRIDPDSIGFDWAPNDYVDPPILAAGGTVNLNLMSGDCAADNCCEEGNFNSGIAVARTTGDVYIANECPSGKVIHLSAVGTQVGDAIDIGQYPSSVQADPADNILVPTLLMNGDETAYSGTRINKIVPGIANTFNTLHTIDAPYLGGIGDMTGRYASQPPEIGVWRWVHDTYYPGYDKWKNGQARYVAVNITDQADFTVLAQVADSLAGNWTGDTPVTDTLDTFPPNMPSGRFIRFTASFVRGIKRLPEVGPQAVGIFPLLTRFEIIPANTNPAAICQDRNVLADVPEVQSDDTFSTTPTGRICGAILSPATAINQGSFEPDTAEMDSIPTITPTLTFYDKDQYIIQDLENQFTPSLLTINDAHGGQSTCAANVNVQDTQKPAWVTALNENAATRPNSGDLADIATLCIWPPNYKYYCWLDITANTAESLVPLYDNCAGSVPIGKRVDDIQCTDSDPRSQPDDCVVYQDSAVNGRDRFNMCIKAQRRTVYTNKARTFRVDMPVTDASTGEPGVGDNVSKTLLEVANIYSRQIMIPPLWSFKTRGLCDRPEDKTPRGAVGKVYSNSFRK